MYKMLIFGSYRHLEQLRDKGPYNAIILCYFCLPKMGVSVPLKTGYMLLFNPLVSHMVSSHCRTKEDTYCVDIYMNNSILGLNDSSLPLGSHKREILDYR